MYLPTLMLITIPVLENVALLKTTIRIQVPDLQINLKTCNVSSTGFDFSGLTKVPDF